MIIALIALVLLVILPAQAQTITMANPDNVGQRDIMVYWSNGSFYGLYNTTSIITLDANESYIFTLKPQGNSWIDDPTDWLGNHAYPYVVSNMIPLIVIFAFLGILIGGLKR
jgi:hypothetical protein